MLRPCMSVRKGAPKNRDLAQEGKRAAGIERPTKPGVGSSNLSGRASSLLATPLYALSAAPVSGMLSKTAAARRGKGAFPRLYDACIGTGVRAGHGDGYPGVTRDEHTTERRITRPHMEPRRPAGAERQRPAAAARREERRGMARAAD